MKHRLSKNKIFNVHLSSIGPESVQRKDGAEKEISSNKKKVDYGLRKSFCLISTSFRDNKKVLLLFTSKRGSSKSHNPSEGIKKYWQLVSSYTIIPMLLLQITLQKSKHNNMQTCCLCEISFREETARHLHKTTPPAGKCMITNYLPAFTLLSFPIRCADFPHRSPLNKA